MFICSHTSQNIYVSYTCLVILKLVLSLFTIYFKLERFMVWLLDHGWGHMLCAGHGRLLSAQIEGRLMLLMGRKISLWLFMWFRVMKMVKEVELQLCALVLLLSFALISTKDNQYGHLYFC